MRREHVATYLTRTGLEAMKIERIISSRGHTYYNYTGKHGAGSGHSLDHVKRTVRIMLATRRVRLAEGEDLTKP